MKSRKGRVGEWPPTAKKLKINLREVGVPSRNILHVRGRGSKSRFRVVDGFAGRAPKTYFEKSKVVEVRPILTSSGTLFFCHPFANQCTTNIIIL